MEALAEEGVGNLGEKRRFFGFFEQFQTRGLGGAVALFGVAGVAGADEVLPRERAAHPSRRHMVHGHLDASTPAVLAVVGVAGEDGFPRELQIELGAVDEVLELDDGRERQLASGARDETAPILEDFGLAKPDQLHSATGAADVDRLVIKVKNQHLSVPG